MSIISGFGVSPSSVLFAPAKDDGDTGQRPMTDIQDTALPLASAGEDSLPGTEEVTIEGLWKNPKQSSIDGFNDVVVLPSDDSAIGCDDEDGVCGFGGWVDPELEDEQQPGITLAPLSHDDVYRLDSDEL